MKINSAERWFWAIAWWVERRPGLVTLLEMGLPPSLSSLVSMGKEVWVVISVQVLPPTGLERLS